jgi:uncharacterized protein with HEPN domain
MRRDNSNIRIIIEYCERVEAAISQLDEEDFLGSYLVQSSCAFSILQIGEAVKRLSIGFAEEHPEVSWSSIAKFRDVLAHRYGSIDLSAVWTIASVHIPILKEQCIMIFEKK